MKITSRYSELPGVTIIPDKVPPEFRHLISLAKEWSISDDVELVRYIQAAPEERLLEFVEAFKPHLEGLWKWHEACEHLIPQPDELVLFDSAANAVATVQSMI